MSLEARLQTLRDELRDEIPLRLHSRAIPILRDYDGLEDRRNADEGGNGLPFSAAFHRYLGFPDGWGLSRLAMLSIIEVSESCASRHPNHRRPLFTRSLCSQLLFEASYLGQELDDLEWKYRGTLSRDQIVGLLSWALGHAEQWRTERFARWTKVPGEDAPMPERRPFKPAA